jgi:hypothetical protein
MNDRYSIEPVNPHENAPELSSELPKNLQNTIEVLETYKRNIVNKHTLDNRDPSSIQSLKIIISKRGKDLIEYLKTRRPPPDEDELFRDVKKSLDPIINPWNPEVSTLAPYYVNLLFIESSPLTLTVDHIETLKRNAGAYNL